MFSISTVASSTKYADGERQSPRVMMLMVSRSPPSMMIETKMEKRDGDGNNDGRAPIAEEDENHDGGESRSRQPLPKHTLD